MQSPSRPLGHSRCTSELLPTSSVLKTKTNPGILACNLASHVGKSIEKSRMRRVGSSSRVHQTLPSRSHTDLFDPISGLKINQAAFISQPVPGDLIILHAGTNDICQTDWTTIKQSLESFIARYSHCSIVVFTVPPRYDLPHLNKHINRFNTLLKYAVRDASNVKLIITKRLISPKLFKADGLHYNDQGKDKLARKILSLLQDIPTVPDSPPSFSQLRYLDDSSR
ncbi:hypothetical protein M8J75_003733 [Diaphorina citri]|nr:hypothetical protein M8J75_003733 [Diaphorina citri]KAI5750894.1 hypothetical protein M8J77_002277 [Diaphorina citri]